MQKLNNLTIFVGDVGSELGELAQKYQADAYLIDVSNYNEFLTASFTQTTTVYTCLGDLPKDHNILCSILDKADHIMYCPPAKWSDGRTTDVYDPTNSIQGLTEALLSIFKQNKNNVTGLDRSGYINTKLSTLVDQRASRNPQLWIAGCSLSHGVGIDRTQSYGHVMSQALNLPVSYLTASGSCIDWAADQILRSDIKAGDIVVWGLTHESRISWWNDISNKLHHIVLGNDKSSELNVPRFVLESVMLSKTQLYKAVISVNQVINFCKKIQAKLFIAGFWSTEALLLQIEGLPEFAAYKLPIHPQIPTDFGSDNQHPGPKQHQLYAEFCLAQLKKRGHV
jgi:hypothetical protein